jgi:hypothetical protein
VLILRYRVGVGRSSALAVNVNESLSVGFVSPHREFLDHLKGVRAGNTALAM